MPKPKPSTIKLQVFKGREAKLNKAIFTILAHKDPQTIYDIHKQVKVQRGLKYTRYATVNKRVRFLEELRYVDQAGIRKTKAGFEATVYTLTDKAYLAMLLDSISLEDLLVELDDVTAITILAEIAKAIQP